MSLNADRWAAGSTYEEFMGRWSRRLAPEFVAWLQVPAGSHWLDVGCGTGALTQAICDHAAPASVLACDPAAPFIEYAREHNTSERASFVMAGAGSLPTRPDGFGCVTSSLALNFLPDPAVGVAEMRQIASRGGTVSACVWDYAGRMDLLRHFWDVAARADPAAVDLDEGRRFPLCNVDRLLQLFAGAGLREVRCEPIEIPTVFTSFEEYWAPFLGRTGPAPAYVAALDAGPRSALAADLERTLPTRPDGAIALVARAWAVRGIAD